VGARPYRHIDIGNSFTNYPSNTRRQSFDVAKEYGYTALEGIRAANGEMTECDNNNNNNTSGTPREEEKGKGIFNG
jgi:hypothetical protein